ncbi:MAG: hypothetical protein IPK82_08445 [Polyangiaceae bacterium]|nr:hypothetical protein [Polyangiaceae bacterium]
MYVRYFPRCPDNGPIYPEQPFGHFGFEGAVPRKCRRCKYLFEGECTRNAANGQPYLMLDHGPCPVDGPTDPVQYENEFVVSKVQVPRKCSTCRFLRLDSIQGFVCGAEPHIWGDFPRGLDWGSWRPSGPIITLPAPFRSTRDLTDTVIRSDKKAFVTMFRKLNPEVPLAEIRRVYELAREQLTEKPDIP